LICQDGKTKIEGIGFNLGSYYDAISTGKLFDIVFTIEENTWNGRTSLQLNIKDIKMES